MSIDSHGARITRRDVTDLDTASQQLATAADTIRSMGPKWGEAVVNLLIAANVVIERLQNKGARAFARYLEKHGTEKPQDGSEAPDPGEPSPDAPNLAPDEEET